MAGFRPERTNGLIGNMSELSKKADLGTKMSIDNASFPLGGALSLPIVGE
jgi:hypothetical protein